MMCHVSFPIGLTPILGVIIRNVGEDEASKIKVYNSVDPKAERPRKNQHPPHLGSMIFSVLLAPGNAARCKGNGKQGVAGVAALAPGAMDSRGGRNRGQNATPAVTATPRAASRHLCTMRWAAFLGHPDRGQGMERERG